MSTSKFMTRPLRLPGLRWGAQRTSDPQRAFVLGGSPGDVDPHELIEHGLAGYAVARASELGESLDPLVNTARIGAIARHLVFKRQLTRLVGALASRGIDSLLFKGFPLAEFDYPDPSWRSYSDVDLAIRWNRDDVDSAAGQDGVEFRTRRLETEAAKIATELGLEVAGRPGISGHFDSLFGPSYNGHAILQIWDPNGPFVVDVHLRLIHNTHAESTNVARAEAITTSVWEDSRRMELGGVTVRVPSLVDSAVVGLILSRSWSTDAGRLRPSDYLDLLMLSRKGVDQGAIERRAADLGCRATAWLFLRRCDPASSTLELRPPNALTRFLFDTVYAPERGHRTLIVRAHEARHLPKRVRATIEQLGNVNRHQRIWRSSEPHVWPAESLSPGSTQLDRETWRLTQFALRRAFQFSGSLRPQDNRSLALAALMYALRSRGVPVERVRAGGDDHLELNGVYLRPTVLGFCDD